MVQVVLSERLVVKVRPGCPVVQVQLVHLDCTPDLRDLLEGQPDILDGRAKQDQQV